MKISDSRNQFFVAAVAFLIALLAILPGASKTHAADAESDSELAKQTQNPVANLISVPFQNNTYFDAGPYHRTANALLIEPVIPFKLDDDWLLITRTIVPLLYQPRISPSQGETFGLGDMEPQFYLSPAHPGSIIWGFGPELVLPTATDKTLGVRRFGGGPAAVALTIQGPVVAGALVNNVWTGYQDGRRINEMTLNPFFFYNLRRGWYLCSSPVITADWDSESRNIWTVPVGGGIGRLFKIGGQSINARVQGLYNVSRPDYAPSWQLQFQIQFLFPTKKH